MLFAFCIFIILRNLTSLKRLIYCYRNLVECLFTICIAYFSLILNNGVTIYFWRVFVCFLCVFFSVWHFSVLHGHSVFSSPPHRPMTTDFEGFLSQILFITSLVWRGPWLGIEPGTSRTRCQHSTTRLSRRRYFWRVISQLLHVLTNIIMPFTQGSNSWIWTCLCHIYTYSCSVWMLIRLKTLKTKCLGR